MAICLGGKKGASNYIAVGVTPSEYRIYVPALAFENYMIASEERAFLAAACAHCEEAIDVIAECMRHKDARVRLLRLDHARAWLWQARAEVRRDRHPAFAVVPQTMEEQE
jgi:hypothetical protein